MIDMRFFLPAADLRSWISSYYILDFTVSEFTDIVQAEQANIRFALSGTFHLSLGDRSGRYDGATLFGHRVLPMRMQAKGPGRVFGAGLLPTGFEALIGMPADRMTDLIVPLSEVIGSAADQAQMRFQEVEEGGDAALVAAADGFFRSLGAAREPRGGVFQCLSEAWLSASDSPEVDDLVSACDLSARQVERLCRRYFGISPKVLSRKSRVLRAATHLRVNRGSGWIDAAGTGFYDQSHFIREFSTFTGLTPRCYAAMKPPIMDMSLRRRAAHGLISPLSLLS